MIERRPWLDIIAHLVILTGIALVAFPIWVTFVASTHTPQALFKAPIPILPGNEMIANYRSILLEGLSGG